MYISINKSVPNGSIVAPPSKSFAQRALICGAFSKKSVINNISFCDDVKALADCLSVLGAKITPKGGESAEIEQICTEKIKDGAVLDCKESATALRFLIPVCLTFSKKIVFVGSKRLFERPLDAYEDFCKKNGFYFHLEKDKLTVFGNMTCGNYVISGEKSSHFVSGMLLALSVLDGESTLSVTGETVSKPYIEITKSVLKDFGVCVSSSDNTYKIKGKKSLDSTSYFVEGDCSSSAYIEALSFLGGNVSVCGLNEKTVQGDIAYKKIFCEMKSGKNGFSVKNCPDLAPVFYAVSCFFGGGVFYDTDRLKYKESDRNKAMSKELSKFGVITEIFDNKVIIDATKLKKPTALLSSHNDHRILMALVPLALKFGGEIENAEAVNKSYPEYFDVLKALKADFSFAERN